MRSDIMYESFFDQERNHKIEKALIQISDLGSIQIYEKNKFIKPLYKQIYIIQRGKVKKVFSSKDGREKIMYFIKPGGMFGEKEYFEGTSVKSTIQTITEIQVSVLNEKIIEEALDQYPSIYRYFLLSIIRKNRIIESQLLSGSLGDSNGRVADFLLRSYYQYGSENKSKENKIKRKYTHETIAKILGCSRVTVTKAFNEFEKNDLIQIDDDFILIKDKERLSQYIKWR